MKTVLITGVNGFVGHHLARTLKKDGHRVIGLGYDHGLSDKLTGVVDTYLSCNLVEPKGLDSLDVPQLDAVIHLAGLANVGMSFEQPVRFIGDNSAMTINLLEYILAHQKTARCIVISSGAVYESHQPLPITEAGQLTYSSPYVVSKLTTEHLAKYYSSRGVETIVIRPFNHIGPGQGPGFLLPDLAQKLLALQSGQPLSVGNLETKRDYSDVRDVAAAYAMIALADTPPPQDIYNVASGESHSGQEILNLLVQAMGITKPEIVVDQSLLRPNDAMDIRGDNSALKRDLGWKPVFQLQQTIKDFVDELKTR